jgi:hypothetical protein
MRAHELTEVEKPRVFYKGYNSGDTRRIKTGDSFWDSHFFVSSKEKDARLYGTNIRRIEAKPSAKILYEGTRPFISLAKGLTHVGMLEWASTIVKRAKEAGYDAVWFKRQGDIGTVIINQRAFNVEKEI